MTRANLLPRSRTKLALFGLALDGARVAQALTGIAAIALAGAAAAGIELYRLHLLEEASARQTALIRANDARRAAVRSLALEVSRLEDVRDTAAGLRSSGNEAAVQLARIGNAIPPGVWLDRIVWNSRTFELAGDASSIDAAGSAVTLLVRAFPQRSALLTSLHRRDDEAYAFDAELGARP
jgi:Tfp pilus assembly protein PilN